MVSVVRWLLVGLIWLGGVGCGGITTKLCGAPGQPCCAEAVCDPGARCGSSSLCEPCGAEGQQCCGDNSCASPLICTSNACVQPVTCSVSCTLGSLRCADANVEQCVAAGLCPEWRPLVSCPIGAPCAAAGTSVDCRETCPGACSPGTLLCTNEGLRRCDASGVCPTLVAVQDDADVPACITGAAVTPELSWESPAPFGSNVVDIAGDLAGSYWVLDEFGNIVRYALGPWEYELRATPGKRMKKLASCGLGSRLYAVGEGGTVFRRAAAAWTEENVGSAVDLVDVACDSSGVYAASRQGRLYVRGSSGGWTAYETGVSGSFNALTTNFAYSELYLAGDQGALVRCSVVAMPPTCAAENSTVTANLRALWADGNTNTVFAVGDNGTLLQRGFDWTKVDVAGLTENFVDLAGLYDGVLPIIVVLGQQGTIAVRRGADLREVVQVPDADLSAVWMPDDNTLVATGQKGALWYRPGHTSLAPFVARGGRKPLTADLHAVTSAGQGRLFAVGANGARVRRQNGTWTVDQLGVATTATLWGVAARSPAEVYAVGEHGTVLVRRWGTWVREAEGLTDETLVAVVFDSTRVWALGQHVLLEKSLSTGQWRTWSLPAGTPEATTLALRKDVTGAATELIIAGLSCALLSFDLTSGAFTTSATCLQSVDFTAATFLSSTGDLLLAGSTGGIYKRAGATVEPENVTGLRGAPWFALVPDGSTAWAVGEEGSLYRRVSGNWTDLAPDVTRLGLFSAVKDDEGLFIVGTAGLVLRRL